MAVVLLITHPRIGETARKPIPDDLIQKELPELDLLETSQIHECLLAQYAAG